MEPKAFTSARHLSLSWASSIHSIPPHPTSWRSILISSHLRLGLPCGLSPSGFPSKTLYTPLLSLIRATFPAHLIPMDFITRTLLGEQYRSFSSSLCSFLHSPVTSSLLFFVCFPGVTTHCDCIFHSPVVGFSLLVFEVARSHTTTRHSR